VAYYPLESLQTFKQNTDYYELNDNIYSKTEDTEPKEGKTYYLQGSSSYGIRISNKDE
jgi:hypothetical protein